MDQDSPQLDFNLIAPLCAAPAHSFLSSASVVTTLRSHFSAASSSSPVSLFDRLRPALEVYSTELHKAQEARDLLVQSFALLDEAVRAEVGEQSHGEWAKLCSAVGLDEAGKGVNSLVEEGRKLCRDYEFAVQKGVAVLEHSPWHSWTEVPLGEIRWGRSSQTVDKVVSALRLACDLNTSNNPNEPRPTPDLIKKRLAAIVKLADPASTGYGKHKMASATARFRRELQGDPQHPLAPRLEEPPTPSQDFRELEQGDEPPQQQHQQEEEQDPAVQVAGASNSSPQLDSQRSQPTPSPTPPPASPPPPPRVNKERAEQLRTLVAAQAAGATSRRVKKRGGAAKFRSAEFVDSTEDDDDGDEKREEEESVEEEEEGEEEAEDEEEQEGGEEGDGGVKLAQGGKGAPSGQATGPSRSTRTSSALEQTSADQRAKKRIKAPSTKSRPESAGDNTSLRSNDDSLDSDRSSLNGMLDDGDADESGADEPQPRVIDKGKQRAGPSGRASAPTLWQRGRTVPDAMDVDEDNVSAAAAPQPGPSRAAGTVEEEKTGSTGRSRSPSASPALLEHRLVRAQSVKPSCAEYRGDMEPWEPALEPMVDLNASFNTLALEVLECARSKVEDDRRVEYGLLPRDEELAQLRKCSVEELCNLLLVAQELHVGSLVHASNACKDVLEIAHYYRRASRHLSKLLRDGKVRVPRFNRACEPLYSSSSDSDSANSNLSKSDSSKNDEEVVPQKSDGSGVKEGDGAKSNTSSRASPSRASPSRASPSRTAAARKSPVRAAWQQGAALASTSRGDGRHRGAPPPAPPAFMINPPKLVFRGTKGMDGLVIEAVIGLFRSSSYASLACLTKASETNWQRQYRAACRAAAEEGGEPYMDKPDLDIEELDRRVHAFGRDCDALPDFNGLRAIAPLPELSDAGEEALGTAIEALIEKIARGGAFAAEQERWVAFEEMLRAAMAHGSLTVYNMFEEDAYEGDDTEEEDDE